MTGKTGFMVGVVAGIITYLSSIGALTFNPAPTEGMAVSKSIIGSLAIISTLFTFLQYYRKKSVVSTTTDGFIAGFASTIDLFAIWIGFF